MTELASFWCGGALGPIELASLRSFLGQGDSITVFSPHPLDLPEGVIWRDAQERHPLYGWRKQRRLMVDKVHALRHLIAARRDRG
ncbi:MAG: hypothetical protein IT542_06405 [Rubellimicrobium sp.]|nr:hypothetical protein [Rubellimicrobium sp.]